jgi:hypothetical protein
MRALREAIASLFGKKLGHMKNALSSKENPYGV